MEIVRLGWYGGDGARLVDTLTNGGYSQPNGTLRSTGEGGVGSRDCANWTVTDTWAVPVDATNGVYLAVIKRTGRSTFAHIGPFTVDNERGDQADIVCKLSDMTWRAYNSFGTINDPTSGKSVYGVGVGNFSQGGRAWDSSYDTPLVINGGVPQTSYWNGERPVHAFLEEQGYNVHYVTCFDVDRDPGLLLGHHVDHVGAVTTSTGRRTCGTAGTERSPPAVMRSSCRVTRCCGGCGWTGRIDALLQGQPFRGRCRLRA